jgi:hypothetical protein
MSDLLKENGLLIGITALCLLGIATQIPAMQTHQARNAAIAQTQSASVLQGDLLSAEQAASVVQSEVANERYDTGCEVISTLRNAGVASVIQEGQPIVAGAYADRFDSARPNAGYYLGRDVRVCDLYGTTAVMRFDPKLNYAVAGSIAVTADRQRMAKAKDSRPGIARPNLLK